MSEDWRRKQDQEAKDLATAIGNYVNHTHEHKVFVEAMSQEHRTLQQQFTGLCLRWFLHLSELDSNWYDLRNEHSVKVAKIIRARLEEEWGSAGMHVPLI